MATMTMEQRIAAAQDKLNQLKAQQAKALQRQKTEAARKQRQLDVRRKVLAGAALLDAVAKGTFPEAQLLALMDAALTRKDDREVFGLEPLPEVAKVDAGS